MPLLQTQLAAGTGPAQDVVVGAGLAGAGFVGGSQLPFTHCHITPGAAPGQPPVVGAFHRSGESGGSQLPSWHTHPPPGAVPRQLPEVDVGGGGAGVVVPPPRSGESGGTQPPFRHTQPATGAKPMQPPVVPPLEVPPIVVDTSPEGALRRPREL